MFDRQTKQFAAAVITALPEVDEDVMQGWIGNTKALQEALQKALCQPKSDFSPHTFFQIRDGLWVSDDFRVRVLAKANTNTQPVPLKSITLERDMINTEIEQALGANHLFTEAELCATVAKLIQEQWGGKAGKLLNNGYANLFYTSSCVVVVSWSAGYRQWYVFTWHRDGNRWIADGRAFSPATAA